MSAEKTEQAKPGELATQFDRQDPLHTFRDQFHFPVARDGSPLLYLVGNSLGLQPKRTSAYVQKELEDWQTLGVRGHFEGEHPWMPYHEFLAEPMANLVGAKNDEVVMMNSLTVNLHLMMATFYRPTRLRHKILIEHQAFPSDYQAVLSQIRWHGLDPNDSLITLEPRPGAATIEIDQIAELIEQQGESIAMILLPGVQYYTGQGFPISLITELAHKRGIVVGFDLAHAAGNIELKLHEWGVDFAVWCSYKYLNSGPGSVGGCYVNRRHATNVDLPRLAGWWGHDKATRFLMKNEFQAIPTAEGWQLSNPPILSLAAIRASLEVFTEAGGMTPLVKKSSLMTQFFETRLEQELGDQVEIMTPKQFRGCQLSLQVNLQGRSSQDSETPGKSVHRKLQQSGVETDWREPNVIRVAPVPLYNSFEDIERFVAMLKKCLNQ